MSSGTYYYFIDRPGYNTKITKRKISRHTRLLLSKILLGMGVLIIAWVAYPLISFQLIQSHKLAPEQFLVPGGHIELASNTSLALTPDLHDADFTQASKWFPNYHGDSIEGQVKSYSIAIPTLGIQDAQVSLIGEDLSKSLVHYGGTAIPGKIGNGVVFGHSILPQFFNPKNYMAIFSTLHTLENGDQILVTYDEVTYQYQVVEKFQVKPDEIWVLDQDFDDEMMTFITCTPPGTYLRRLIVRTKLVPYQQDVESVPKVL